MTNAQTMTKTAATKLARKILAGGHYDRGSEIQQRCPDCMEWLGAPKTMGRAKVADLQSVIVDHYYFGDCSAH